MKRNSINSEVLSMMNEYDRLEPYILNKLKNLPKNIKYHNEGHTRDVITSSERIALLGGIKLLDLRYWLVKTAALLHDTGYLFQVSGKGHEEIGANFAEGLLTNYNYKLKDIMAISGMIKATKLPQNPKTLLEGIICDADVDNFGRDDFFERGELLREELESMGIKNSDKEWYQGTLRLMESHKYHTRAAKYLRNKKKKENIEELKRRIASIS